MLIDELDAFYHHELSLFESDKREMDRVLHYAKKEIRHQSTFLNLIFLQWHFLAQKKE